MSRPNSYKQVRHLILLLLTAFLLFFSCMNTMAANAPAKVTNFTATAGESQVVLTWNKVSNVSGYYIEMSLKRTGKVLRTIKVSSKRTRLTVKDLKNSVNYSFTITAFNKKSSGDIVKGKASKKISVKPMIIKPASPYVKVYSVNDGRVTLYWGAVDNATCYTICQKDSSGSYIQIGTTEKKVITIKNLKNLQSYTFKVYATRTVDGKSRNSDPYVISAVPRSIDSQISDIVTGYHSSAIMRTTVTAKAVNDAGNVTISAGERIAVISDSSGQTLVQTTNGTRAYVSSSSWYYATNQTVAYNSSTGYSKRIAEAYVNSKGYKTSCYDKTNGCYWLIWINIYTQHLYLFKSSSPSGSWTLYNSMLCITGKGTSEYMTKCGVWYLMQRIGSDADMGILEFGTPGTSEYGTAHGYWAVFLSNGANAIHSWRYLGSSGFTLIDGTGLGYPISNGCIRLSMDNASFIYHQIPIGTTTVVA